MRRTGGRLPKITPEIAERVAEKQFKGVPITYALRQEHLMFTLPHWQKSLLARPILLARYEKRLADLMECLMDKIASRKNMRDLPAEIWPLERMFPAHYAQPKAQGSQINVTVNTCVGLEDSISKRAAVMVKRWNKKESKVIDVQTETKQIEDKTA